MHVLYIHGFNSAGFGNKVDAWREAFGAHTVINPTLPVQPAAAMTLLRYLVQKLQGPDFCVMGSSLGGFYALNLAKEFSVKTLLINGAIKDVAYGLDYAKNPLTNYKTDELYRWTDEDFAAIRAMELSDTDWAAVQPHVYAYLDADDEVLPSPQIHAFLKDKGIYTKMFPGGDHRFQHMAEAILDFKAQP